MFSGVFNSIMDKLSGLNPIKTFLKYAIDKTLNQILNDQLTLQDFKNGCLNVTNIGFNVQKINKVHLIASPYILHNGSIGNLKIILPPLSEISKKSIQIQVHDVLVQLKPNKDFYQNFKVAIRQIQQNDMFYVQENTSQQQISENSPIDFFKQLLKQILLNIKIKVNNVILKLYMNSPDKDQNKDQYYVMLRIPQVGVNKNSQNYQKSIDKDEIRFNIQVPQFSVHLLNQSTSYPQFQDQKYTQKDFPFNYPTINHPSTILLFGLSDIAHSEQQNKKQTPKITFFMITDYKLKKKQFLIKSFVSNIQIMIDPLQLQILGRFAIQIKQFKNIFEYVKNQLNLRGQKLRASIQPSFRKNKSNGKAHEDIFSSVMFNSIAGDSNSQFLQSGRSSVIRGSSRVSNGMKNSQKFIDDMIKQNPDLNKSVLQFNSQFKKQIEKQNRSKQVSQQFTEQFRSFNFSSNFQFQIEMSELYMYMLKCVPFQNYRRYWIKKYNNKINESIPISYFMLAIRKVNFCLSENGKSSQLSVTKLKFQNIKISKSCKKQDDQFMDLLSSTQFYKQPSESFQSVTQSPFKKQLRDFKLKDDQHYCIQQIVRISQKPAQNFQASNIKKYSFLPKPSNNQESQYILYKPGFKLHFNNKQQYLKVDIQEIGVCLNSLVIKQIVEILYPVFSFKHFAKSIDVKPQITKMPQVNSFSNKKFLLQSQYTFNIDQRLLQNFIQSNKKQLTIILNIHQINIAFYSSIALTEFQDLVKKHSHKKQDSDNMSQQCFCKVNSKQFYFQCLSVQLQKKSQNVKISLKKLVSGIVELQNSKITNITALIKVQSHFEQTIKVFIDKSHPSKTQTMSVYIPDIQVFLSEQTILQFLNMAKKQLIILDCILNYGRYLKIQMQSISNKQVYKAQIKNKKSSQNSNQKCMEVFIKNFHLSFLQIQTVLNSIYFKKYSKTVLFKLDTIILAQKQAYQYFLGQMKNQQLCLTQYFDKVSKRKFQAFADKNIILQIHNPDSKLQKFHSKNKNEFFLNRQKQMSSIQIKLSKQQIRVMQKNKSKIKVGSNQKFRMIKFRQNISSQAPTIQEEQAPPKILQVNFNRSINICVFNAVRLTQKKQRIDTFVAKVKQLTTQIALQSKTFTVVDRKQSNASDTQTDQFQIKIGDGNIFLDVRPQFKRKDKQIIFSNTRSCIKIAWSKLGINLKNVNKYIEFSGIFKIKFYFLQYSDRQVITNPLLISQKELQSLGFAQIFQIDQLKLSLKVIQKRIQAQVQFNLIRCQMGASTLGHLKMHVEHFMMHNIRHQQGITLKQQEDQFCVLQPEKQDLNSQQMEQDELQVEDLTHAYQKYTQKLSTKKQEQEKFLKIQFIDPIVQNCAIDLEKIKINKLIIKIFSGSDFEFINVQSLDQSKQKSRNKKPALDQLKYIEIRIQNFYKCSKIITGQNLSIQSLVKIELFQINMSYSKPSQGFFKRLINNNKLSQQIMFPIVKNQNQIKVLIKHNQKRTYVKFASMNLDIGFRSDLLSFIEQIKKQNSKIRNSGWKKIYPQQKLIVENKSSRDRLFLIMIPEAKLNMSLVYNGIQMLSNQSIRAQQFLLHEEIHNQANMQKVITKWIQNLLINNVGGLISGSAIKLFSKIIQQIFVVFKFLLGNLFGRGSGQEQFK